MAVYMVTYDLTETKEDRYTDMENAIKAYGSWAHIQKSVWMIKSSKTSETIYDEIVKSVPMLAKDKLLIIETTSNYKGWQSQEIWDWLKGAFK